MRAVKRVKIWEMQMFNRKHPYVLRYVFCPREERAVTYRKCRRCRYWHKSLRGVVFCSYEKKR